MLSSSSWLLLSLKTATAKIHAPLFCLSIRTRARSFLLLALFSLFKFCWIFNAKTILIMRLCDECAHTAYCIPTHREWERDTVVTEGKPYRSFSRASEQVSAFLCCAAQISCLFVFLLNPYFLCIPFFSLSHSFSAAFFAAADVAAHS